MMLFQQFTSALARGAMQACLFVVRVDFMVHLHFKNAGLQILIYMILPPIVKP